MMEVSPVHQADDSFPVVEFLRSGAIVYFDRSVILVGEKQISKEFDDSFHQFYPTKHRSAHTYAHKQVNCELLGGHDTRSWMKKHGITASEDTINTQLTTLQLIGKMALMAKLIKEIPEELAVMEDESRSAMLKIIKSLGKNFFSLAKRFDIDFSLFDESDVPPSKVVNFLQKWMEA